MSKVRLGQRPEGPEGRSQGDPQGPAQEARLQERCQQLEGRLESTLSSLEEANSTISQLRTSPQYRYGQVLTRSFSSLRDMLATPLRLWRTYRLVRAASRPPQERQGLPKPEDSGDEPLAVQEAARDFVRRLPSRQGLRVLFVATNGAGLGHLNRSLAVARRLKSLSAIEEIAVLTTSPAINAVLQQGFKAYYLPPAQSPGESYSAQQWNQNLRRMLGQIRADHGISLLIFDGVLPYPGMRKELSRQPSVWIRRGNMRPGIAERLRHYDSLFDLVVIPGEYDVRESSVKGQEPSTLTIPPVVFLDDQELLERRQACVQLGLDAGRTNILVQLGAGNIDDSRHLRNLLVQTLRSRQETDVVIAESIVSRDPQSASEVRHISRFPLSRYYRAFDCVVCAAGYNTVSELLHFAVPCVLVPNLETVSDDQEARARTAGSFGAKVWMPPYRLPELAKALDELLDRDTAAGQEATAAERERPGPEGSRALLEFFSQGGLSG